jgi:MFS family permease
MHSMIGWLNRWRDAVLLGLLTIGAYGVPLYTLGVLLTPIRDAEDWSLGALAGAYGAGLLVAGGLAPLIGRALDRTEPRNILAPGLVGGSALILAASYADAQPLFLTTWAFGAGVIGASMQYNVTMPVTARLYPAERRAAAYATLTLVGAVSSPIFFPLAGWLAEEWGWRTALRALTVLMIACSVPAIVVVRRRFDVEPPPGADHRASLTMWQVLRSPVVFLTLGMVAVSGLTASSLILHQVPLIEATGLSLGAAAALGGMRGFLQIPGRLILSPMVKRVGIPGALSGTYLLALGGLLAIFLAGPPVLAVLFVTLSGLSFGVMLPLHGLFAAEVYGLERLGTLTGIQQAIGSVAAAGGPFLVGLSFDATDGYRAALIALLIAQIGVMVLFALQRQAARREAAAATP